MHMLWVWLTKMSLTLLTKLVILISLRIFSAVLATVLGCVVGGLVSLALGDVILSVLNAIGVHGIAVWQFGGFVAFVGSLFRTKVEVTSKGG